MPVADIPMQPKPSKLAKIVICGLPNDITWRDVKDMVADITTCIWADFVPGAELGTGSAIVDAIEGAEKVIKTFNGAHGCVHVHALKMTPLAEQSSDLIARWAIIS